MVELCVGQAGVIVFIVSLIVLTGVSAACRSGGSPGAALGAVSDQLHSVHQRLHGVSLQITFNGSGGRSSHVRLLGQRQHLPTRHSRFPGVGRGRPPRRIRPTPACTAGGTVNVAAYSGANPLDQHGMLKVSSNQCYPELQRRHPLQLDRGHRVGLVVEVQRRRVARVRQPPYSFTRPGGWGDAVLTLAAVPGPGSAALLAVGTAWLLAAQTG